MASSSRDRTGWGVAPIGPAWQASFQDEALSAMLTGMGVVSWIALGALVGLSVHARAPGRFPGGIAGTVAAGTAGGFLGGGIFTLAAQRGTSRIDLMALAIAVVGAVLILVAARSAGYADPGPR